jgi:hypothetical protein
MGLERRKKSGRLIETCRIETQFYEDIITQDNFKLVWDICNITPTPTPTPTPIPISCDIITELELDIITEDNDNLV